MNVLVRCGFPEGRIFLASDAFEIKFLNRTKKWTYKEVQSFLHEMFPCYFDRHSSGRSDSLNPQIANVDDAYSDFNFWKLPMETV